MDQYPQAQLEKPDVPEFLTDREKTQFYSDAITSCQNYVQSIALYRARPFMDQFDAVTSGERFTSKLEKVTNDYGEYEISDRRKNMFTPNMLLTTFILMSKNLSEIVDRPDVSLISEMDSDTYLRQSMYGGEMKARELYEKLIGGTLEFEKDDSQMLNMADFDPNALFNTIANNKKELFNASWQDIRSKLERNEDVATSLISLQTLIQLSGKKALYSQFAEKVESIIARQFPELDEEDRDLSELRTIHDAKEKLTQNKKRAIDILKEKGLKESDFLTYTYLETFARILRATRINSDSIQQFTMDNIKTILNDEVSDDDPTISDEGIINIISLMQRHNIPLPPSSRSREKLGKEQMIDNSEVYNLPPTELDWEVLPPGELEDTARDIVNEASSGDKLIKRIDLSRLTILESIRDMWGKDSSYYSRGVRNKRSMVRTENGEAQPDEYIVLVLQEVSAQTGEVVYEHAVAESPIAGPNALFVYRQDANEHKHGWRSVMSLPKKQSEKLGAKRIKHTLSRGATDLNATMVAKVEQVITIDPADVKALEFNGIDKDGNIKTRLRKMGGEVISSLSR